MGEKGGGYDGEKGGGYEGEKGEGVRVCLAHINEWMGIHPFTYVHICDQSALFTAVLPFIRPPLDIS